jgi:hypothetical protein
MNNNKFVKNVGDIETHQSWVVLSWHDRLNFIVEVGKFDDINDAIKCFEVTRAANTHAYLQEVNTTYEVINASIRTVENLKKNFGEDKKIIEEYYDILVDETAEEIYG